MVLLVFLPGKIGSVLLVDFLLGHLILLIYYFSCLVDWFCNSAGFLAWSIGFVVVLVSAWSFVSAVLFGVFAWSLGSVILLAFTLGQSVLPFC